ncbi:MAG TPA: hypothetical protein VER58_21070 [Thermoanaerobaculia bacterium]|nr:hypothetical protein [Thermoanaerobaculia bacterium]
MKSSLAAVAAMLIGGTAMAAQVDFKDPRRALGREGDVRVDAELAQDTISQTSPINVTYQIQNLSAAPVAIADRTFDTNFDCDSRTIRVSIGAEVPPGPNMPHLAIIRPGEKRVFSGGALLHIVTPNFRTPWTAVPRYIQIQVMMLRDVTPFQKLIELQSKTTLPVPLSNEMFDRWVEASESVLLNTIPVYWKNENRRGTAESDQPLSGTY